MSNFLAIATVTATLQLEVVQPAASAAVSGATVTVTRPDNTGSDNSATRVNIYMYQVSPNAAWRNRDLPTRNSDGGLVQRPRVALDLNYLLTFYGDESQLEPQRMLGNVALAMHTTPVLTRGMIQDTITHPQYSFLAESNLDDEVELVKFTPLPLSLEELSKLWSVFFQTQYALSIAYQATIVLIESELRPRSTLPVLEREIFVETFRYPTIERIRSSVGEFAPIQSDSTIVIEGRQLRGEATWLRIGGSHVIPLQDITDTRIVFLLSSIEPTDSLRAGVQAVQVIHPRMMGRPRDEHVGIESNVAPLVLRPRITSTSLPDSTRITIGLHPPISRTQRVLLLLNDFTNPTSSGYTFIAGRTYQITDRTLDGLKLEGVSDAILSALTQIKDKEYEKENEFTGEVEGAIGEQEMETHKSLLLKYAGPGVLKDAITFHIAGVAAGTYLLRVQVDGAESVLQVDEDEDSETFKQIIGPKVTIP
jgi:hypothetical protein